MPRPNRPFSLPTGPVLLPTDDPSTRMLELPNRRTFELRHETADRPADHGHPLDRHPEDDGRSIVLIETHDAATGTWHRIVIDQPLPPNHHDIASHPPSFSALQWGAWQALADVLRPGNAPLCLPSRDFEALRDADPAFPDAVPHIVPWAGGDPIAVPADAPADRHAIINVESIRHPGRGAAEATDCAIESLRFHGPGLPVAIGQDRHYQHNSYDWYRNLPRLRRIKAEPTPSAARDGSGRVNKIRLTLFLRTLRSKDPDKTVTVNVPWWINAPDQLWVARHEPMPDRQTVEQVLAAAGKATASRTGTRPYDPETRAVELLAACSGETSQDAIDRIARKLEAEATAGAPDGYRAVVRLVAERDDP